MRDYDGKTADERVAERRARLIDAGLEVFGEHGYAGTSIRAVLRQSGLRDRYFGESFPDLDSLLAAVYDQLFE
ncbi:MAG TPA: TetR family transcriptional regulator [Mycobacterium sp.]